MEQTPEERKLELQQFYDKVQRFDWFHEMSDSHEVFLAGEAAWGRLRAEAFYDPDKTKIIGDFRKYRYSGKAWGTEQFPKPVRP